MKSQFHLEEAIRCQASNPDKYWGHMADYHTAIISESTDYDIVTESKFQLGKCLKELGRLTEDYVDLLEETLGDVGAVEAWKDQVLKKYPEHAGKVKFRVMTDAPHISAEIQGPHGVGSLGFFDMDKKEGHLLDEETHIDTADKHLTQHGEFNPAHEVTFKNEKDANKSMSESTQIDEMSDPELFGIQHALACRHIVDAVRSGKSKEEAIDGATRVVKSQGFGDEFSRKVAEKAHEDLYESFIVESLTSDDDIGTWIKDFQDSKNPKFEGKSKEERRKMAVGAYYGSQKEKNVSEAKVAIKSLLEDNVDGFKAAIKNIMARKIEEAKATILG